MAEKWVDGGLQTSVYQLSKEYTAQLSLGRNERLKKIPLNMRSREKIDLLAKAEASALKRIQSKFSAWKRENKALAVGVFEVCRPTVWRLKTGDGSATPTKEACDRLASRLGLTGDQVHELHKQGRSFLAEIFPNDLAYRPQP